MKLPGFSAEASLYSPAEAFAMASGGGCESESRVEPQACACTSCVRVGGGRWCVTIPIINRRVCVNVPSLGFWQVCGCVRFGWPPFTFNLRRC